MNGLIAAALTNLPTLLPPSSRSHTCTTPLTYVQMGGQMTSALPVLLRVAGTTDTAALTRKALDDLQSFSTVPAKLVYEVS